MKELKFKIKWETNTSELITNHEQIWHDDDWYEGINDD